MSYVSYFFLFDCRKYDEYCVVDEFVYEDVLVLNCEKNNGYGDYKWDFFSSFSLVID